MTPDFDRIANELADAVWQAVGEAHEAALIRTGLIKAWNAALDAAAGQVVRYGHDIAPADIGALKVAIVAPANRANRRAPHPASPACGAEAICLPQTAARAKKAMP